ncbi:SET domain protein 35 [Wolffia australiana]
MTMETRLEEEAQRVRCSATELLLLEQWEEYIGLYTRFISLCESGDAAGEDSRTLRRILCGALCNRAEARLRLGDSAGAAGDCDRALDLDPSHPRARVCKGKALLSQDRYSAAGDCFRSAIKASSDSPGLLDRCVKLEAQSKTGIFDLSHWILDGCHGDPPELAEFVGPVEIRRAEGSGGGRGLFATRNVEAGTTLVATKAVATGRGILPESPAMAGETARLVLWKDLVERLLEAAGKCGRTLELIYQLSGGEGEGELPVPDIRRFLPEAEQPLQVQARALDVDRILKILDVNCMTDDAAAAEVLGKKKMMAAGVGLWLLASLVNHSCCPNARRLHVGDHLLVHASRDIKAGEEITFSYVDALAPLGKRRTALAATWGFRCGCRRCEFEEAAPYGGELREKAAAMAAAAAPAAVAAWLEEAMGKRWGVKDREKKGFLRASFWGAYAAAYASEREANKWARRLTAEEEAAESVAEAVGGDGRLLEVLVAGAKRRRRTESPRDQERLLKMARRVYGKVAKKKAAFRTLIAKALLLNS